MPSGRRAFLAGIGGTVGLAGCLGDGEETGSGSSTATRTPTPVSSAAETVPLGDPVDADGVTVTVSDPVVAHSVRYLTAPDAFGVAGAGGDQFVFVAVAADGGASPPDPAAFALAADGERYNPGIEAVGPARVDAPVTGRRYGDAGRRGHLAFRVPAPLDADDVAVVLADTARWTVPAGSVDPLRPAPPSFVATADAPDSVPADEPILVTLDVTNEGDGRGVFRGAVNQQGPLYGAGSFGRSLAAGASATPEPTVDSHLDADVPPDRVRFAVLGPGLSESFEVTLEGGGTPVGTRTGTATTAATRRSDTRNR